MNKLKRRAYKIGNKLNHSNNIYFVIKRKGIKKFKSKKKRNNKK